MNLKPIQHDISAVEEASMAPLCAIFRTYLKSNELKYTPERAEILDAIITRDALFEVDELVDEMRERGFRVSKATIYRTVKLLEEAGIINQAMFDPKQSHYQLAYGRDPKDYMICVNSGQRVEFTDPLLKELREKICREHGWEPIGHRFQIYAVSKDK